MTNIKLDPTYINGSHYNLVSSFFGKTLDVRCDSDLVSHLFPMSPGI